MNFNEIFVLLIISMINLQIVQKLFNNVIDSFNFHFERCQKISFHFVSFIKILIVISRRIVGLINKNMLLIT